MSRSTKKWLAPKSRKWPPPPLAKQWLWRHLALRTNWTLPPPSGSLGTVGRCPNPFPKSLSAVRWVGVGLSTLPLFYFFQNVTSLKIKHQSVWFFLPNHFYCWSQFSFPPLPPLLKVNLLFAEPFISVRYHVSRSPVSHIDKYHWYALNQWCVVVPEINFYLMHIIKPRWPGIFRVCRSSSFLSNTYEIGRSIVKKKKTIFIYLRI